MYAVGRLGSYISRGVYTVSGPFHPFGGAVDIIVVEQPDGSFKSSPWYVRFGKFQGVLKTREKEKPVSITVNGIEANFNMFLDHKGEAYFLREMDVEESETDAVSFPLFSGEETDASLSGNRKPMKSKSCSYDVDESNSVAQVDMSNGKLVARTSSRRPGIFGLVFGKRSIKENSYQEGAGGTGVMRSDSLERAELAAELLEVKWSTNLASNRSNNIDSRFSSTNDVMDDKGSGMGMQNDEENLFQAYVHDKEENSVDRQTSLDKMDYCNKQEVSCFSGFDKLECSVEEASLQVSCLSGEQQIVETSLIGEGFMGNNIDSRFSSTNDVMDNKGSGMGMQNDEENLFQAYVHDKEENSVDRQTSLDKMDYCNKQEVSCFSGFDKLECSVEEASLQVSCLSGEQQIVETSLIGEGFMGNKCKSIANISGAKDDSIRSLVHDENVIGAISGSGISGPDTQSEYKFESCIDKKFDEVLAGNDNVSDSLQAFVYGQMSESSVITLVGSSEKTLETLWLSDIGNGEAHVQAETLLTEIEAVPEVTLSKPAKDMELGSPGALTMSESYLVGADPVIGLEEIKSHSIHITSPVSDLGDHVENGKNIKDVVHPSLESVDDSQNFYGDSDPKGSVSPSERSEDEQFLFTDLDAFKLHESNCVNKDLPSFCTETEEVNCLCNVNNESWLSPEKFVQENPSTNLEISVEKARIVSNPISISRNHRVAGEKDEWQVESLPNIRSPLAKFDVNNHHPLSRSLDSNSETMKWTSIENDDSSCIRSDADKEQQLAHEKSSCEESGASVKLKNTLSNPAIDIFEPKGMIPVDRVEKSIEGDPSKAIVSRRGSWQLWPFSMRRSRSGKAVLLATADTIGLDAENAVDDTVASDNDRNKLKPNHVKKMIRAITPTSEQLASLNLKEGMNHITFTFSTNMLGKQQVDARIHLWKWNTRIVISDVDGTITRSDVLGQFMPMVGVDWSQSGVAHLFSAIKENGYQLLFLSARAISQAYITRKFLVNLKQDGKALPDGPIVISPDGLFPSLYREVIRRAPHEFKITCLEDIKALFPPDCNPFYAGFGNRDTDEISYLKVGIPKGKIFIINPKGEVAMNHCVDKSYGSLHDLVHAMFPPMVSAEQEDFNSWNFWKLPPPLINI